MSRAVLIAELVNTVVLWVGRQIFMATLILRRNEWLAADPAHWLLDIRINVLGKRRIQTAGELIEVPITYDRGEPLLFWNIRVATDAFNLIEVGIRSILLPILGGVLELLQIMSQLISLLPNIKLSFTGLLLEHGDELGTLL